MSEKSKRRPDSRLIGGIILILIGVIMSIDRIDFSFFSIFSIVDILALVAIFGGAVQILQSSGKKETREGAWWMFLGLWFYISYNGIWGLGFGDTWPILVIAWGADYIWKSVYIKQIAKR